MNDRIMPPLPRSVRRRLARWRKKCREAGLARRIRIIELYDQGWSTVQVSEALGCAPATAVRVLHRFRDHGEAGLEDGRRENGLPKIDDDLLQALFELLRGCPEDFGWQRPTWTQELLAAQLEHETGVCVSVTTVARMLRRLGARWGAARPVVACPWSRQRKTRRLRHIRRTLRELPPDEVAFYVDEVDIHLNPKIGKDWTLPGWQRRILTPGKNVKRYLAGALAADGSDLVFVEAQSKNSDLFLLLLNALMRRCKRSHRIHLVLDNYCIHSSRRVQTYLARCDGLFQLHFLPPYCPDDNRIERLWRELHANVTRNHRCRTIRQLMDRVRWYLHRETRRRRAAAHAPRPCHRRAA